MQLWKEKCDQLKLDLLGHEFACSLYVFDFVGFGIILGMDWLERYDARIFCPDRKISLRHPNSLSRIIYSVENSELSACTLLGAIEVEKELNRVFVAKEFADVFEPVTRLPPKRAVEFRIDLVP